MKTTLITAALLALAFGALGVAHAGELTCDNACPLAKSANAHRAVGKDAQATSAIVQADVRREVLAQLARI